ncbi:branched-chain amino acid ABC transporter permease [Chelatococcus asaccharovorans]|uniref:branched-chain amino acid ABC transporter permease n=1 Tax=Chelatococcus asaccharovorans TaxID=28210 RepID=UPI00224C75A2|nr:branched-chain amino acid ABC transporter permease [Chelatococcus asaccharovorans]CAH1659696.1 Amino acid/amide ABC transporter membrane protein 1 (HAAT family) [Chelatococcus asaccharovorans]CAH1684097.1 Amino acid/amide ABC transporter membrane protein 1 (HAAT family) [Chelatococcus asaccharovorans]
MINQLINGLVYGGLLVILSSGLVLIFGLRQVVNFAHGAFYTLGAYVALSVSAFVGFWGALAAAFVALSVVGIALDRFCFRPLQNRPHAVVLIITFGLFLIVTDLVQLVWGRESYSLLPPPDFTGPVDVFGTPYPVYRLVVLALAVVAAVALQAWLRLTRIGLHARAAATDIVATGIQGVNTDRVGALVVGVGCGLAGLAGAAAAPLLALTPSMGDAIIIDSFVVMVIGGLGSFGGSIVAAALLGQIQAFGAVYMPSLTTLLPFVLMAAVLVIRPTGLAGARIS